MHISQAINILNDGKPHKIEYISKKDGHIVNIDKAIVTSSNFELKKFNVMSIDSRQVRWIYYLSIIGIDNEEVYL